MPAQDERGDVEAALAGADVRVDAHVPHGRQSPQPVRSADDDGGLGRGPADALRRDQGVRATQLTVAHLLGLPLSKIRVITQLRRRQLRLQGDGLAARHARRAGRPPSPAAGPARADARADVHLKRAPRGAGAHITLGATRDGRLTAIRHEKLSVTSPFDDWAEPATGVTSQIYASRTSPACTG